MEDQCPCILCQLGLKWTDSIEDLENRIYEDENEDLQISRQRKWITKQEAKEIFPENRHE